MKVSGRITDETSGQGVAGMCAHVVSGTGAVDGWVVDATATTRWDGTYTATWTATRGTRNFYMVMADAGCGANWWWTPTESSGVFQLKAEPGETTAAGVDMQVSPTPFAAWTRNRMPDAD